MKKKTTIQTLKVNLSDSLKLKATDITLLEKGLTFLQFFVLYKSYLIVIFEDFNFIF